MELQNQQVRKRNSFYQVKTGGTVKAVDMEKRIIKAIANTYNYIDEDGDMLVKGCAVKSIQERGPQSNAVAKIKHQADHSLSVEKVMGRITRMEEMEMDGREVLYFESKMPETRMGDEHLANYQEGMYDNHSIGFKYVQLELAERGSEDAMWKANWDRYYENAINKERADEMGYFFVVKEIKLYEISTVSFGSNQLTPYLGSKDGQKQSLLKKEIIARIDGLKKQYKTGKADRASLELEAEQLKQIVQDLQLGKPESKPTPGPGADTTSSNKGLSALWAK